MVVFQHGNVKHLWDYFTKLLNPFRGSFRIKMVARRLIFLLSIIWKKSMFVKCCFWNALYKQISIHLCRVYMIRSCTDDIPLQPHPRTPSPSVLPSAKTIFGATMTHRNLCVHQDTILGAKQLRFSKNAASWETCTRLLFVAQVFNGQ